MQCINIEAPLLKKDEIDENEVITKGFRTIKISLRNFYFQ